MRKYWLSIFFSGVILSSFGQADGLKLDSLQEEIIRLKRELSAKEKVTLNVTELVKQKDSLSLANEFLKTEVLLLNNKLQEKGTRVDTVYITQTPEPTNTIKEGYYVVVCSHKLSSGITECPLMDSINGVQITKGEYLHTCINEALEASAVQNALLKARNTVNKEAWFLYHK